MVASSSEFSAHHSKDIMDPNLNENEIDLDLSAAVEFNRKYDIRERLGKGLSSVVYVCVEKNTGIELAVKVMDISVNHINADGMDIVQQIHEEIRLLRLMKKAFLDIMYLRTHHLSFRRTLSSFVIIEF